MSRQRILPVQVGTHARHHAHAAFLCRGRALAKEIASIQKFPVAMKRHLRRIERENARHADKHDIGLRGMPVVRPCFDIHHRRIVLGHVRLAYAAHVLLPGLRCRIRSGNARGQSQQSEIIRGGGFGLSPDGTVQSLQ